MLQLMSSGFSWKTSREAHSVSYKNKRKNNNFFISIIKTSPLIALIGIISIHRPESTSYPLIINHTCFENPHCYTAIFAVCPYLYTYLYIVTLTYWHMLSRCVIEHALELLNTLPIILIFITFLLTSFRCPAATDFYHFREGRTYKIKQFLLKYVFYSVVKCLLSKIDYIYKKKLTINATSWEIQCSTKLKKKQPSQYVLIYFFR